MLLGLSSKPAEQVGSNFAVSYAGSMAGNLSYLWVLHNLLLPLFSILGGDSPYLPRQRCVFRGYGDVRSSPRFRQLKHTCFPSDMYETIFLARSSLIVHVHCLEPLHQLLVHCSIGRSRLICSHDVSNVDDHGRTQERKGSEHRYRVYVGTVMVACLSLSRAGAVARGRAPRM